MANINEIYQSEFLRADQLGGQPRRAVIEATTVEVLGQGENAQQKLVLKFKGAKQRLPLNKTNALSLASAWGPNTDNWIERKVELRPERVLFSGKMVDSIRLHPAPAAPAAAPAAAPVAAAAAHDGAEPDGVATLGDDLPWEE